MVRKEEIDKQKGEQPVWTSQWYLEGKQINKTAGNECRVVRRSLNAGYDDNFGPSLITLSKGCQIAEVAASPKSPLSQRWIWLLQMVIHMLLRERG